MILPPTRRTIRTTRRGTQTDESDANRNTRLILRRILGNKRVCRNDTADISESDNPTRAHRSAVMTREILRRPADLDGHGCVGTTRDHEESAILEMEVVMHGEQDDEACQGDGDRDQGEDEAVVQLVGAECDNHTEAKCGGPGRDGVQLRFDGTVTVGFDDGRTRCGLVATKIDR